MYTKYKNGNNNKRKLRNKKMGKTKGITLIALVITTIFSYDEKLKVSNNNGFFLQTIQQKPKDEL